MNKRLSIAGLLLVFLLLLLLYPKTSQFDGGGDIKVCNCIGIEHKNSCFGILSKCHVFSKEAAENAEEKASQNLGSAALTLLLDKSRSMQGTKLEQAKNAAQDFVSTMSSNDAMAIIGFDKDAEILQEFTNDKDVLSSAIADITAGDETYYIPALNRAYSNFNAYSGSTKKIIFLSDGEPSKDKDIHSIYDLAYKISSNGICIYTIGYGNDVYEGSKAENILKNMANISKERAGCGNYYHSSHDWSALRDIFSYIYQDWTDTELSIRLNEPKDLVYKTLQVPLNISTNVMAVCSYRLNNGNSQLLFNKTIMMDARPGRNKLSITCRKSIGKKQTRNITAEFYVKAGLMSMLMHDKTAAKESMRKLDNKEIEFMLDDIIEKQKLNVIKKMSLEKDGTLVYVLIENTKPVPLKNVHVKQLIPKTVVSSVDDISSKHDYQITSIAPAEIEFMLDKIEPGEVASISYYIDKHIDSGQLSSIKTEIRFDSISRSDLDRIIVSQNKTRDLFDISTGIMADGDRSHGIIRLSPNRPVKNLKIYLNVPKCMAYRLNKIYFKNNNYRVVSDDPLVMWQLSDADDDIDLEYDTDKRIEEECEKQISVLTIGEAHDMEAEELHRSTNTVVVLLPLLLLPLIIIIIINKRFTEKHPSDRSRMIVKLVLIIFLVAFLILFFLPKDRFKNDNLCECFGISSRTKCLGITHSCFIQKSYIEAQGKSNSQCSPSGCDELKRYMNTDPYSRKEKGVDLLLLLDHSKSMEGEQMQQAKAAMVNLVSQIEPGNRISVIKFDDSSELVHQFTNNRQAIIESINGIDVGRSTKYVPALITAHRNFLNSGDKQNQWQMIFVSDGAPGDEGKPESIYKKVREMAEDDICINIVGFGSDITPGSEAETILKEMAHISKSITGCGVYSYSVKEMDSLSRVLGNMYEESKTTSQGIDIEPKINSLELSRLEELSIQARLSSKINSQPIPGEFRIGTDKYCSPEAELKLVLKNNGTAVKEYRMEYDPSGKYYSLNVMNLPAGKYDAWLTASINAGATTSCGIEDSLHIGTLVIHDSVKFDTCYTDDCLEISKYLFSSNIKNAVYVYITDYAYVPQNISITDGTTVIWKNIGKKQHTVTSGKYSYNNIFNSRAINPGGVFNFTFKKGDSYDYFDNLSRDIKGGMYANRTKNISIGNFSLEYKNNIDLSLLIDKSGSMAGDKLANVKKAADRLVNIIYPGDRISIIRFSDNANIANKFTDDKSLLLSSIDKLRSGGSTLYIPAFRKAAENYREYGNNRSGQIIIFLSDGEPWDNNAPYSIYKAADDLIRQGVCIYAIGYGEEVFAGSKSEEILKRIVELSEESTECGKYMYSPSNEIRLSKIFGSIYYDAIGDIEGLKLEPAINKKVMFDNETLIMKTKVKSMQNNRYLPGFENESGLCGPPAKVTGYLKSARGKLKKTIKLKYLGEHTGYYAELSDIKPGAYELEIKAESVCSDDEPCNYFGTKTISFTVLSSSEYSANPMFLVFVGCLLLTTLVLFLNKGKTD